MDIGSEFKEELADIFSTALFFNNLETELAIFEALISEVHYFGDRCKEDGLDPEVDLIRKEELQYAYDQYNSYKDVVRPLLEEYMVKIKETDEPIHMGYYKVLKQLRGDYEFNNN